MLKENVMTPHQMIVGSSIKSRTRQALKEATDLESAHKALLSQQQQLNVLLGSHCIFTQELLLELDVEEWAAERGYSTSEVVGFVESLPRKG